jgi:hypothetical protein
MTVPRFDYNRSVPIVFQFLFTGRSVARPLPTQRTTRTQTSAPRVGFEPTISAFEWAKTVTARPL